MSFFLTYKISPTNVSDMKKGYILGPEICLAGYMQKP